MSAPSVDWILVALTAIVDRNVNRILVAPKGTVDRNVIFHCWHDFGSSENYGYKVHKDPHVRGNSVIHCVVDQQVKEMKATNSPASFGCLRIDRE